MANAFCASRPSRTQTSSRPLRSTPCEKSCTRQFTPSRNGEHLLLLDQAEHMRVRLGNQIQTSKYAAPLEGCDTAQYGEVYTLKVGEHYAIEFAAGAPSPTLLFLEHLETFGDEAWTEGCDDGE